MIAFHVTELSSTKQILQMGLQPMIGPRSRACREPRPAVWLFPDWDSMLDGMNWLPGQFEDNQQLVVLEIDLSDLSIEIDEDVGWEISCPVLIGPQRIRAVTKL